MMITEKNKRMIILTVIMVISCAVLLIVFFATDDLTGDKEFSEYTREDWEVAIVPLCIMAVSAVSTLVCMAMIVIPMLLSFPAIADYVANKKLADIDPGTQFLIFDHDEFKRACCRHVNQNGIWFSVKEYDLKARKWIVLETGRYLEKSTDLVRTLHEDYQYNKTKFRYL